MALLLLLVMGFLSYRLLKQQDATQQWVSHTHQVMEKLDDTLTDSVNLHPRSGDVDSKTGSRPDAKTLARLEASLSEIKSLTADRQQKALQPLSGLVRARSAVQPGGQLPASPGTAVQTKEPLEEIRGVLLGMRQEEERLEGERLRTVGSRTRTARTVLGAGYILTLVMLTPAGLFVLREMERRTRTEEQLGAAQKKFRLLFDSNPIPVWVFDLETLSTVDVNAVAISHYGYSREEFLRFKITDIRPQDDVSVLMNSLHAENDSAEDSGPWR
jgi:PAS domain-containing protein